jgi:Ca2+-binding RTX toxin-like protein
MFRKLQSRVSRSMAGGGSREARPAAAAPRPRARSCVAESLEDRRLLAGISLSSGHLVVTGTTNGETISVNRSGSNLVAKYGSTSKSYPVSSVNRITLNGDAGSDTISVGSGVIGARLNGGSGNDKLTGGDGNDSLYGDDGNDTLDGRGGADYTKGGGGTDTADYSRRTGNVFVFIGTVADDGENGEGDNVYADVENVLGGAGNDKIVGNASVNDLRGNGGNDELRGGIGGDRLSGGSGDDRLYGEDNGDGLYGDDGNDSLDGGAGNDGLRGGNGGDFMVGGTGGDDFEGGPESGATGFGDSVSYYDYTVGISATLDGVRNDGAPGENDLIRSDVECIFGGFGNDTIVGDDRDNTIFAEAGNDVVYGRGGDDTLIGNNGVPDGLTDDDLLDGGDGNDDIHDTQGTNTLTGGNGDDEIDGGIGNDTISGGAGRDQLRDTRGANSLDGGADPDRVNATTEAGFTTIARSADGKTLTVTGTRFNDGVILAPLPGGAEVDVTNAGESYRVSLAGVTQLAANGGNGDDVISLDDGTTLPIRLDGGADDDYLYGNAGNDTLLGGTGNDYLYGRGGNDSFTGGEENEGGEGNDVFEEGTAATRGTRIDGGAGNDSVNYAARTRAVTVTLAGANRTFTNGEAGEFDDFVNVENVSGGSGNDTLTGDALGNILRGNGGNDTLDGLGGNDFLSGGEGTDRFFGGDGDDQLFGRDSFAEVLDGGAGYDKAQKGSNDTTRSIEELLA